MTVATRWPMVGRRRELDSFTVALDDAGCQGFCIYGPPGVGKTRLGDECAAVAEAAGRAVHRATGERSTSAIPFAGIAHLLSARALVALGSGERRDSVIRARLLDAARRALQTTSTGGGTPVLLLDDANRMDTASLMLIDDLMASSALFCVATVVTGEPVPETVIRWWREERATRVDLSELDAVAVDTLLHVVLEGPLDEAASTQLWNASRGNMLALRELVLSATSRHQLTSRDGVWQLTGELVPPERLRELVERRFEGLPEPALDVLERLALCQPLALERLAGAAGLVVLEDLERAGLITVHNDGRRESVRLAHPLHGEVLRAGLPRLRTRSILLAEADALVARGARRREDPLRIACWRLDATGRAEPELLLGGARIARYGHDFRRAAMLAEAALAAAPSAASGLVLGEALYNLGSFEEAEVALAEAASRADGEDEVVRIATVRRRNLFRGCRREAEAMDVGRAAAATVASSAARDELRTGDAEILAIAGRPAEALALLEAAETTSPRLRVLTAIPTATALAMTGRTADAIALSRQAYREHLALGDELAISSPGTHRVNRLYALVQAGRLIEADERGGAWFEAASGARNPLGVMWTGVHLARGALAQGRPATVLRLAERTRMAINSSGFEGLRPTVCALEAVANALLGDAAASAARADEGDAAQAGFGFLAPELALGRAWASVANGELVSGRAVLLAAGDDAARAGHVPTACWLLHDAARLGAAQDVARPLAQLAAVTDSALAGARARHAAALVAADAHELEAAADRFEALGACLAAAEAIAAAAAERRRRHERRSAAALDLRVDQLLARCEGARTPALVSTRAVVPLTAREREIAALAAAGRPSKQIAERLYLSVRTVDNHLSRIYDKLGVSSRADLATALELPERSAP